MIQRLFLFLLFLSFAVAVAQNTTIKGRVVDKDTGEPLPGVNVIVPGTYKGAATDMGGEFVIKGLSPGDYDIKASMIGYTIQLKTGIRLMPGRPVDVVFELETQTLGNEIETTIAIPKTRGTVSPNKKIKVVISDRVIVDTTRGIA